MEPAPRPSPKLVTTVVGAGPAGLLFCIASRLLFERAGGDPETWSLILFDKRADYSRTHRLRLAPAAFLALQEAVESPLFDGLIDLLRAQSWKPAVNVLEAALSDLAGRLGVQKERLCVGSGPDEVDLPALRDLLVARGRFDPMLDTWTLVAADSVHSNTRELVRGRHAPIRKAHQHVVRLKLEGDRLPERMGEVARYKLAKVFGSILDYRHNPNGHAEVDLFVDDAAFAAIDAFGATPKNPVLLDDARLADLKAPLFAQIVRRYQGGVLGTPCRVSLQSTFALEHTLMQRVMFEQPQWDVRAFLVGDAAISLPFFRGMSCLTRCAQRLAEAHCDMALGLERGSGRAGIAPEIAQALERQLSGEQRVKAFGGWVPLPGRVVDSVFVWHRGKPAYALIHKIVWSGVHVLHQDEEGRWSSLHYESYLSGRAARRALENLTDPARRYQDEVTEICRDEVAIVKARARLIRGAREFIRLSALVPWQVVAHETRPGEASPGVLLTNLAPASVALAAAWGASVGELWPVWAKAALIVTAALAQIGGGALYHYTRTYAEHLGQSTRIWRTQSLALMLGSAFVAQFTGVAPGRAAIAALVGLGLVACFVVGLYVFEWLNATWWARADLKASE